MSFVNIDTRFRVRRRTAASWTSLDEPLLDSEIGLESDTVWPLSGGRKFKIGPGAWNSLEYAVGDIPATATDLAYDNTVSGLVASDVQDAIDELAADISAAGTDLKTTARLYDEGYLPAATMGWTVDAAGSAAQAQQSVVGMNGAYGFPSGASTANRTGMLHAGFFCEVGGGEIRAYARLEPQLTPSGSQQSQYGFGLKSGTNTTGTADYIHVIADDTTGGWLLKWVCQATGTNGASVIPGAIVGGTIQQLELVIAGGGGSVSFSLGGVVVDTLTLPAGFVALKPYILSRKNGASGGSSTLWLDKIIVEQDR